MQPPYFLRSSSKNEKMITLIWVFLAIFTIAFSAVFIRDINRHKNELEDSSWLKTGLIGFVVNFFDVLGIGAFAPQTALLKFNKPKIGFYRVR
jgi:hypothetical protein